MYIASSSITVKFHSFPDGELIHNYQPGCKVDGPIRDISWSRDGNWLALVPKNGPAEIISIKNHLKLIHTIGHISEPICISFQNTTKKFVACGTRNGLVMVYDVKSRRIKYQYPRYHSQISHIQFTAKDSHLVAGCTNGDVLLYSCLTNALSATYHIPKSTSVSALNTNQTKRNLIVGGSNEGVVVVWDSNVNQAKFVAESHQAPVTGVVFSPINSELIISTGSDRQFCCYDIISNKCIAKVPVKSNVTGVDFSSDGTHFVTSNHDGNVCLYDSRRIIEPVLIFEAHKNPIKKIIFQKNSTDVSSVSDDQSEGVIIKQETEEESFNFLHNVGVGCGASGDDSNHCITISANQSDSFITAMGLKNSNVASPPCEGEKFNYSTSLNEKSSGRQSILMESERKSVDLRKSLLQKQISTSTPNNLRQNSYELKLTPEASPILEEFKEKTDARSVSSSQPLPPTVNSTMTPEDFRKFNEKFDQLRREMLEKIESVSYDTKYQIHQYAWQTRKMMYDNQMMCIKEFLNMENTLKNLREDLASGTPISENYLLEENMRLKQQVALLQQELARTSAATSEENNN